jgi:C-terminal processing protease CtpA/Prc
MKNKIINTIIVLALFASLSIISSCTKEKIYPPGADEVTELHNLMNYWYYWKDSIPDVDPDDYSSPDGLLEAMRYIPRDKWSYITTQAEHSQYYEEGTYIGYGFGYAPDADGNVRITFLFDDSDLRDFNIERGWIIKKINGTVIDKNSNLSGLLGSDDIGVNNLIEFESPTGDIVNENIAKKLITMNTVGEVNVLECGVHKVGYFVFKSFIGPSIEELTLAFGYFQSEGITDMVIDLRYNGGGRMDVVDHMAGLIIPDHVDSKLFLKYEHNADRSNQNESVYFDQDPNSLRLNKIYFITGKGSASASEVIINGLNPYLDVYIVGDDTYGKPVGMYSFSSNIGDLVYVPISFKMVNADDFGGYYEGLKADSYVEDDISKNFGVGEAVLDEVIYHIEHGSFSGIKSSGVIYRAPLKEIRSIKDERGTI